MATNPKDVFDDEHQVDLVDDDVVSEAGSEEIEYEDEVEEEGEGELVEEETEESVAEQATPVKKPSSNPGKVTPSSAVKKLDHKSPESVAKASKSGLSPTKNPFPSFGQWTEKTLSEIEIVVPVLTGKNESTNDLTRESRPEARYWKSPIIFKYGNFTSETLRFDNVPIPYHTGKNYGSSFVYLCLPGFAAKIFSEACKARRPTRVTEKSLVEDHNRWWKVANDIQESVGIFNKRTGKFHKKSLEAIFDATSSGVLTNVTVSFMFKASTDSKDALKPTTQGNVAVSLVRANISEVDVNVQMPVRISRAKNKTEPPATSVDIANDKLMERLSAIGL